MTWNVFAFLLNYFAGNCSPHKHCMCLQPIRAWGRAGGSQGKLWAVWGSRENMRVSRFPGLHSHPRARSPGSHPPRPTWTEPCAKLNCSPCVLTGLCCCLQVVQSQRWASIQPALAVTAYCQCWRWYALQHLLRQKHRWDACTIHAHGIGPEVMWSSCMLKLM